MQVMLTIAAGDGADTLGELAAGVHDAWDLDVERDAP